MSNPYLSIVASSRNDNHGNHLKERMQAFIDGILTQSKRHQVLCELILVEWNPPAETTSLEETLTFPATSPFCSIRIIQVSPEVHAQYKHSSALPFFQMLGKNVGIRRAKGEFILATNIDILFSDEIFKLFKKKKLRSGILYRNNRLDIPYPFPKNVTFDNLLSFCERSHFRNHGISGSRILMNNKWIDLYKRPTRPNRNYKNCFKMLFYSNLWKNYLNHAKNSFHHAKNSFHEYGLVIFLLLLPIGFLANLLLFIEHRLKLIFLSIRNRLNRFCCSVRKQLNLNLKRLRKLNLKRLRKLNLKRLRKLNLKRLRKLNLKRLRKLNLKRLRKLHTNGCGDFTLLSRNDWHTLKGYPEWSLSSWHLDSVFLYQACMFLTKQKNFSDKKPIYHIEHSIGSGYSPEGVELLFNRLESKGIGYITGEKLDEIVDLMFRQKKRDGVFVFNDDQWGLGNLLLTESMPTSMSQR